MGTTFFDKFTLLRPFFRSWSRSTSSSNFFHLHPNSQTKSLFFILALVASLNLSLVSGTESDLRRIVGQEHETGEKPQTFFKPHPQTGNEDGHLTGFGLPFYPNSRVLPEVKDQDAVGGHENGQNHILLRRSVRNHGRSKRQVQNTYERFYLCMFTLFSNPNCRDGPQQSESSYYGQEPDNSGGGHGQLYPTSQPNNQNQGQGQGQGFFGTGGFGNNGISGGRFGLHPSQPSFTHNYTPFFGHQQNYYPQQTHSTPSYDYYQPHPQILPVIHQTPYPEPQVHRRPGPPPPTFVPQSIKSTTRKTTPPTTTTSTTTRAKPSTSGASTSGATTILTTPTTRRTTTSTTRPSTTTRPTTTTKVISTRIPPPYQIKVENVLGTTFPVTGTTPPGALDNSLDCENGTETHVTSQKVKLSPTTPPPPVSFSPQLRPSSSQSSGHFRPPYPDLSSTVKTLAKENANLKSELDTLLEEASHFREQNKFLQDALSSLQSDNGKLKGRVGQLERTNDHLQQQNGQLQHSTGDMRTQVNEMRGKVKYAEEKLVRLSRQSIEDQKLTTRLQNRVRDLNKENSECKSQLYQLELRLKKKHGGESLESESGEKKVGGRFPQQIYRDDILSTSTSTEQGTVNRGPLEVIEFDGESSERTTVLPGSLIEEEVIEVTTLSPNSDEGVTGSGLVLDDEPGTTTGPGESSSTSTSTPISTSISTSTTTPQLSTSTPTPVTPTTPSPVPPPPAVEDPDSSQEFFNFPSMSSESFAQHPGIIFDDEQFGPSRIVGQDEDDDSNELAILLGHPDQDPNRSLGGGGSGNYAPANFDAFSSFSQNQRPNPNPNLNGGYNHPFNNYWPYHQYSGGGGGGYLNSQGQGQGQGQDVYYTGIPNK